MKSYPLLEVAMSPLTLRRWIGAGALVITAGTAIGIGIGNVSGSAPHSVRTASTPSPTVAQWMRGGGARLIHSLGDDFTALNGPDRAFDLPQMAVGCRRLLADVRGARAYAPIPDATIEARWSTALALYVSGAADCAQGAETHNYSLIITSATELSRGTSDVVALTPRLDALAQN